MIDQPAAKGQEDSDPGKTVHKTESRIQTIRPFRQATNDQASNRPGSHFHGGRA
jgi:hypothetical protein